MTQLSSTAFYLFDLLCPRRETAEPSGRTAFLQTQPATRGDVSISFFVFFFALLCLSFVYFLVTFSLYALHSQPVDLLI